MARWQGRAAAAAGVTLLAACASIVSSTDSPVLISTNPPKAQCAIKGHGGFATAVETPAKVVLPASAAPLTVTCSSDGRRTTSYTLDATANGWIWGNSALMVVTGGVAVIGALVDESRSAGKVYKEAVTYDLDVDRPRLVQTRQRGGEELKLQAR
ncbi:MAG: hypothetical protein HY985_09370 [Magnetospirillum sp.]|nr:hypothetical protein [Magnetospirillum sp.]